MLRFISAWQVLRIMRLAVLTLVFLEFNGIAFWIKYFKFLIVHKKSCDFSVLFCKNTHTHTHIYIHTWLYASFPQASTFYSPLNDTLLQIPLLEYRKSGSPWEGGVLRVLSWEAETVLVISFHCQMSFRDIGFFFPKNILLTFIAN